MSKWQRYKGRNLGYLKEEQVGITSWNCLQYNLFFKSDINYFAFKLLYIYTFFLRATENFLYDNS